VSKAETVMTVNENPRRAPGLCHSTALDDPLPRPPTMTQALAVANAI